MKLSALGVLAMGLAAVISAGAAEGPSCPPGMEGSLKVVVRYFQGPNWQEFRNLAKDHLSFLVTQMKGGTIEFAGPFPRANDNDGGMAIFNSDDPLWVDQLIQNDSIIAKKVATYEVKPWLKCSLKK